MKLNYCIFSADSIVRVVTLPNQGRILAPGIEIKGVQPQVVPRRVQQSNLAYEEVVFCPFFERSSKDITAHFWELIDLIEENNFTTNFKTVDLFTNKDTSSSKIFTEVAPFKFGLQVGQSAECLLRYGTFLLLIHLLNLE